MGVKITKEIPPKSGSPVLFWALFGASFYVLAGSTWSNYTSKTPESRYLELQKKTVEYAKFFQPRKGMSYWVALLGELWIRKLKVHMGFQIPTWERGQNGQKNPP